MKRATSFVVLGSALLALVSPARAEEGATAVPAYADPSPFTGAAVTDPSLDARLRTLDAAGRRASDAARAEAVAPLASGDAPPAPVHGGRGGLGLEAVPNYALERLRNMAMRTVGNTLEPTPETVRVVAAEAWGDTMELSNDVVITAPRPGPRYFEGMLRPATMDDAPAVLRVYRALDRGVVPPPSGPDAPAETPRAPSASPFDFVKGVLIRFDDAALAAALGSSSTGIPAEGIEAAEREILEAPSEADAARRLEEHAKRWLSSTGARPGTTSPGALLRSVSLRDLLAKAAPWRDRWKDRPVELRTVGGLTRIAGVVVDEEEGDVRLLGRVEEGAPAIVLDDLAEGLRAAWRDGVSPMCTLDPSPKDVSGPQYAHVFGVRRDSSFALTMLEADYAMKRLLFGAPDDRLEIPGWRTLAELMIESPGPVTSMARFWLHPVQPAAGDILLAADGRSALFRAGVQVLSEEMVAGERGIVGTGRTTGAEGLAAQSFSEHYDEIGLKRPVFRRLAGLFDVVLAARILHTIAPEAAVLRDVCALPEDRVLVPTSYAGVVVTHAQHGLTISGGCDVGIRPRRRAWLAMPAAAGVAAAMPVPFERSAARAGETAYALGSGALARGELDSAVALADRALDHDVAFAEAYALRASARLLQGDGDGAIRDAEAAVLLEPGEPEIEAILRRVLLETGRVDALDGIDAATRAALARTYAQSAAVALTDPAAPPDSAAAERAVQVDPTSPLLWTLAGWARLSKEDAAGAEEAADRAVAVAPDDPEARTLRAILRMRRGELEGARTDLDHGLAHGGSADLHAWRATQRLLAGDVEGAAKDVEAGFRLAPRSMVLASAARFVQAAGHAPLDDVRRSVGDLLRLPLRAEMAVTAAYAAAEEGRLVDATRETARALEVLDALGAPRDLARTRIELQLLAFLPAAAALDPNLGSAGPRAEALAQELLERHPDFASIRLAIALARYHLQERDAAFEALEAGIGLLGAGRADPLLSEMIPGDPSRAAGVFRVLQVVMLIGSNPTGSDARMATVLADLSRRLEGSPAKAAADGIAVVVEEIAKEARRERSDLSAMRQHLSTLDRDGLASADLLESLVVTFFTYVASNLEGALGEAERADTAARVMWRIRPRGEFSPIARALLPQLRGKLCQDLFALWTRVGGTERLGLSADSHAKKVREAAAARTERARTLGEPAFWLLVADHHAREVAALDREVVEARVPQLERVARVAADGPKKDRLLADLATARERLARAQAEEENGVRERILAAYRSAQTMTQIRTIDRILGILAAQDRERAALYVAPEESAELGRQLTLESVLGARKGR